MAKILLILENSKDSNLLRNILTKYFEVVEIKDPSFMESPGFDVNDLDLFIIDGINLKKFKKWLIAAKQISHPIFLPILLIISRKDINLASNNLWRVVDELIITPVAKVEILTRVNILLRTRRMSLDLKQQTEIIYNKVMENSVDHIFILDKDGTIFSSNIQTSRFRTKNGQDLVGKSITDIFPDAIAKKYMISLALVQKKRQPVVIEYKIEYSKSMNFYSDTIFYIDLPNKEGLFGVISKNVTKLYKKELMLAESEEQLRAIFMQAAVGIAIIDLDGNFISVNEKLSEMLGYSSEELSRLKFQNITHPDHLKKDLAAMNQMLEGKSSSYSTEKRYLRKDESIIWVNLTTTLYRQKNGKPLYFVSVLQDISEKVKLNQEKKLLEEAFYHSQKMEALGRLAGGVAHDFNNLLSVMRGYGELILESLDKDDPIRNDLEEIVKAAQRASSITQQLLAFSRKQHLQPKIIDVNKALKSTKSMYQRLIGEKIRLEMILSEEPVDIFIDPGNFDQVIMNLVVNARDAMSEGGTLTIKIEKSDSNTILDKNIKPGNYMILSVIDNGIGMDEDTLAHIFDPFFTTKEKGKGTGLGLSTVYGIVKQSSGYITVQSEVNVGTTFKIYLPIVEAKEDKAKKSNKEKINISSSEKNILIVEDEKSVREMTKKMLTNMGYMVDSVECGNDALRFVEKAKKKIDIVITDIVMPGISGFEFRKRLREKRPEIGVIYMSGYSDDEISPDIEVDSSTNYISKPFSSKKLKNLIENLFKTVKERKKSN